MCLLRLNSDTLVFRLRMQNIAQSKKKQTQKQMPLDQSDEIFKLKFSRTDVEQHCIGGIKDVDKVIMRKIQDSIKKVDGQYEKKETWVLTQLAPILLTSFRLITSMSIEHSVIILLRSTKFLVKRHVKLYTMNG